MAVTETTLIDAGIRIGLLTDESVHQLRLQAKRERLSLVEVAMRAGRFPEAALYRALADVRKMPFLQQSDLIADQEAIQLLPRQVRQQRLALPVKSKDGTRLLALADPDDRLSIERIERATGMVFEPALADPEVLKKAILKSSHDGDPTAMQFVDAREPNDPVRLLDSIMKEAYLRRASDIHFEPQETGMRIRLRVDGHLQDYSRLLTASDEESLINRVKVLASLDIAEQRMTQDGAMKYAVMDWNLPETDIRVAAIPTRWGERITLRILGQETGQLSLEQLGMTEQILQGFNQAINRPHGMILVTGPTGSGKSTTLYAAIRKMPLDQVNVLTVEDPIEQSIAGINQVQVSGKVDFAQALRSFLRHDPDVILVGEIRDRETADIGLRAAMTGHMVLSTLHTNDSVSAVTRLADIGVEPYLIGSTLIGLLAQRLARRQCTHCRQQRPAKPEELRSLGLPEDDTVDLFETTGCSFCLGTGFLGRIGFFEALWMTQDLRMAIAEGASEREIRRLATHLSTLWHDCRQKILNGDVTLSEGLPFKWEDA
ncbi:MAG TPA: type II/IV secretion system protein [Phycisphaerales bacterium]|nr:type II/IV secretion system protein [Phycisphaerales bacterium]